LTGRGCAIAWALACTAVGATWAGPALADSPLDTLVVTGTRQPEKLATQPGNTAVISQSQVDFLGAHEPSEILNRIPGVFINPNGGVEHLTAIRSPVLTGGAGAGSFLFLEDGVPIRASGFANVNSLFELDTELAGSIEVVRGPGSALYGSNAVHGLINVLSRGPTPEPGGFVDVTGGSFGRVIGRGFASLGTPDDGLTGALVLKHEAGYRANSGLDQQKITLRYDRSSGNITQYATLNAYNLNEETAGYVVGHDAYKNTVLDRGNNDPEAYRDAKATRGAWHVERTGDIGITSLTLYARWTTMNFLQHFLPSKALEFDGDWGTGFQATHQFNFAHHDQLIIGLDGEYADGLLKELQTLPSFGTNPQGLHYDYNVGESVIAPYFQAQWHATPRLLVTAGARYEVTRYAYDPHTPANTIGQYQRAPARTDIYQAFTPKLGASYEINDKLYVFGRLARGARAPQTSDAYRLQNLQVPGQIKEEQLDSIEAGIRGVVHRVAFEIDTYDMWKRNFFFRDANGYNVPNGRTRHKGIEVSFDAPLFWHFELSAAGSYAHHTYDFNRPISGNTESITKGNDVDTAPHWLGNVALSWHPLPPFHTELDWTHVGRYYTDASNEHTYPGHDVLDLRANWDITARVVFHAAVRNLTNTDYAERADYAFGQERYFPGETRGYEAGLELKF
jgi:iron complex outermembrane recepter protein